MATIKAKAIKPKKLNLAAMRRELGDELGAIAEDVQTDFDKTTQTWTHKPAWTQTTKAGDRRAEFAVLTSDEIYGYVDRGTKPHIIRPKRATRLAFAPGGSPKTTPRVIGSTSGSRGGTTVYSKGVQHPGTKPREFEKTLATKWRKLFGGRMKTAMARAAAKSGHAK